MGSSNLRNRDDVFTEFFGSNTPFGRNSPNISSPSSAEFDSANNIFQQYFSNGNSNSSSPKSVELDSGSANDIFQQFFSNGTGVRSNTTSVPLRKAAALQSKLSCSLDELYSGSTRKMKISRNVVHPNNGRLVQETEIILVDVKPGWKKGTKITFPNKGDQELNRLPADVVFVIDEKPHEIYVRDDNDLIVNHKLSLADALAGTTVNLKTLDGRNLLVPVTNIVTPGYEIVVAGEGMPISKTGGGTKGNLKIKLLENLFSNN